MKIKNILLIILFSLVINQIPSKRVVAEWEEALGTMIRWPLGIPLDLVVELAVDDIVYVLVENGNQEIQARNTFTDGGVNINNVLFIYTETYSHWTRDHGPQFLIGDEDWKVINQQFDGYPVESGCDLEQIECDEDMLLLDCVGTQFCNNQPLYPEEGYDCYVDNELCQDFNGDGQVLDWIGDGYCDNGDWGLNFMCDEYSWDCADCGGDIIDENNYCNDNFNISYGIERTQGRPHERDTRNWSEDDDTNIDFANQLNWDILDIPIYWTGGNFMTDGYGMGVSTELMVNENNLNENEFKDIVYEYLNMENYYIFDNPNEESIQHIDCLAKLVNPETIIIKQVSESSPEYECMEEFADSFYQLNTFYDRPFNIYRLYCPEINAGWWETNPVAAYTNSLILNDKVLVPQYGIPEDSSALEVYQEAMPGYEVVGFEGALNNPWYAEDALHCRTMGVFDPDMVHISHKSIRTNELSNNAFINVEAEVVNYGSLNSNLESVMLNWRYGNGGNEFEEIELTIDFENIYVGSFPALTSNSLIEYFIAATNEGGYTVSHPNAGWHIFNTLDFDLGDVNQDSEINIQDIILIINLVLNGGYNDLADLNLDNVIDILDVVQLVNAILFNRL